MHYGSTITRHTANANNLRLTPNGQVRGLLESNGGAPARVAEVLVCPADSPAANYAFDVTPARLVDYIVTERGVCTADERGVLSLFPEHSNGGGGGAGKAHL